MNFFLSKKNNNNNNNDDISEINSVFPNTKIFTKINLNTFFIKGIKKRRIKKNALFA